jgi:hypothetical protein
MNKHTQSQRTVHATSSNASGRRRRARTAVAVVGRHANRQPCSTLRLLLLFEQLLPLLFQRILNHTNSDKSAIGNQGDRQANKPARKSYRVNERTDAAHKSE